MRYLERPPPQDLAPWVACFWQISGEDPQAPAHRVLPDGCSDWLLDLAAAGEGRADAFQHVGPMSTALVVRLRGRRDTLGVRLRPGVAGILAGVPAGELLDRTVPARELAAPRLSLEQLARLPAFSARARLLEHALRVRLASVSPPDPLVRHALAAWSGADGSGLIRVAALARQLQVSERALERRFHAHLGLTPAGVRRLARFRAVLRLHAAGQRDWADLAARCGYSDQPHLVSDFKSIAGLTPTAWAASQQGFLKDGEITAL